jgi:hypothetical protein
MKNLIVLREMLISNFFIEINGLILENNKILLINGLFKYIFYFFPFRLLNYLKFIKIIYKKDTFYYITNLKINMIIPLILNLTFHNENNIINMTTQIKYYNSSIPFKFFIINNNLNNYNMITIKYMSKGIIINKELCINNYYDKLIYELFL